MSSSVPLATRQAAMPLRSGRWVWLYAIQTRVQAVVAGEQAGINEWVLLTSQNENIVFNGNTYYKWPIVHDDHETNSEGNLPESALKIGNFYDLPASILRENNGLEGMRCVVTMVKHAHLGTPANAVSEDYDIMDAQVESPVVILKLGQPRLTLSRFPPHRYLRNGCRWRFGGPECAYDSHEDPISGVTIVHLTCDLTFDGLNGCAVKQNTHRYGGAPSIPEFVG